MYVLDYFINILLIVWYVGVFCASCMIDVFSACLHIPTEGCVLSLYVLVWLIV